MSESSLPKAAINHVVKIVVGIADLVKKMPVSCVLVNVIDVESVFD